MTYVNFSSNARRHLKYNYNVVTNTIQVIPTIHTLHNTRTYFVLVTHMSPLYCKISHSGNLSFFIQFLI